VALAAQGFDRPRPKRPASPRDLGRVIRQLGLLQMDFVNVLAPAHYQVPFSRLGPYRRAHLDELVYRGREFTEQWAHEASIVPVETWPPLRHRMERRRVRPWGFEKIMEENPANIDWVLDQVRARSVICCDLRDARCASRPPPIWPIVAACQSAKRVPVWPDWWRPAICAKRGWRDGARRLICIARRSASAPPGVREKWGLEYPSDRSHYRR